MINKHLAYLLVRNECVVIPGLGAFVASPVSAEVNDLSGLLIAPGRILGFNPSLRHNDGLLANSIAREKGISYKDASKEVSQFVKEVMDKLSAGETVSLAWLGSFSLSAEKKIIFTPSQRLSCNAATYGLSNFYLPSVAELQQNTRPLYTPKEETREIIYIPVRRNWAIRTGVAAAAVLAFLLVPSNSDSHFNMPSQQTAGILPSFTTTHVEETTVEENQTTTEPEAETFIVEAEEVMPIVVEEAKPQPARYYYIVIASLPSRELAEEKVLQYENKGYENVAVISNGDKHRVYVSRFEDKAEAETFLSNYRETYPQHAQAWLLSQRTR